MEGIEKVIEDIGELKGTVKLILKKLDSMERKYNGYVEKTIKIEQDVKQKSTYDKFISQIKIAVTGAVVGAVTASIMSFILSKIF